MHKTNDISRLRWNCRRGMLELDIILLNFLEQAYQTLTSEQKGCFIELLACTDQELFAWLINAATCPEPNKAKLIHLIRQHAQNYS